MTEPQKSTPKPLSPKQSPEYVGKVAVQLGAMLVSAFKINDNPELAAQIVVIVGSLAEIAYWSVRKLLRKEVPSA